ncbi:MAG: sigma 54-interacting transcriptional regulator [Firmicutes bacterium]|jgi:PAS domain S-box-containing protein|nr:sigma 54-interacting transcriptional regulator [Bacillota bacterium]
MLTEVGEFAQKAGEAIASAVGVEVGMVDENLLTVVGTGGYYKRIGRILGAYTVSARVLREGRTHVVLNPRLDEICRDCLDKDNCTDVADIICPLVMGGRPAGCIMLAACDSEQRRKLLSETARLIEFLEKMADLVSRAFNERQQARTVADLARELDTVINSVNDGIISVNPSGVITHVNRAAARMLGSDPAAISGMAISAVFPGMDARELENSPTGEFEMYSVTRGEKVYWLGRVNPVGDSPRARGYVLTFRGTEEIPRTVAKYIRSERNFTFDDILGSSTMMSRVKDLARSIAASDATVLIQGESGTGKELFARAIHSASPRRKASFVAVNCAAIPEALLESELFGYEEGAFTGARRGGKPGKFDLADGGTLFLDEIADLPLHLQAKLLRAIEDRQVERLGGRKPVRVNIRVIAATNRNLARMAESGEFRQDLYYRLAVIPIVIPPLREHREDIPEYVHCFSRKYASSLGKHVEGVTPAAIARLMTYPWPGNIRELANAVEYAVNVMRGELLDVDCLPAHVTGSMPVTGADPQATAAPGAAWKGARAVTRESLEHGLATFGRSTAGKEALAKSLGISRATLYRRLKEYGL